MMMMRVMMNDNLPYRLKSLFLFLNAGELSFFAYPLYFALYLHRSLRSSVSTQSISNFIFPYYLNGTSLLPSGLELSSPFHTILPPGDLNH